MAYISFQPSDFFNTVLYTGTGSARDVTGYGFQPDWVWIKQRSGATYHRLYDSSRGAGQEVYSNATDAESDGSADQMSAFISDGFSIPTSGGNYTNINTGTYAAWGWKADGGTTESNTDGTITSTVQANTTAGFSIVTYTGNGTTGATFGHGLGVSPSMFIIKDRSGAANWPVWNKNLSTDYNLYLNTTDAAFSAGGFAGMGVTSSLIQLPTGGTSTTNTSGQNYVCYVFADVKGYSKFGSYTGNGSTDGTFVYTGFRPAIVIIKLIDTYSNQDWVLIDNKRSPYNVSKNVLYPNNTNSEATSYNVCDLVSNGFKFRNGSINNHNGSGLGYIYMAFAEFPLVGSNGLAGTAR